MFKKGQLVRSKETGDTYIVVDFFWEYSWFVMVQVWRQWAHPPRMYRPNPKWLKKLR